MKHKTLGKPALLLTLAAGALTAQTPPPMATPGTVNYTEGSVSINGAAITDHNTIATLQQNQTLSTAEGKAEILLSPGSILRIGDHSEIRMVAPELVNPRIEVLNGSAMLEVDRSSDGSNITILQRDATVSILKKGLYRFDDDASRIAVIDGKLEVSENGDVTTIGKGKAIVIDPTRKLNAVTFDRNKKDDLFVWSQIRSESLADASAAMPPAYSAQWVYQGDGWYWSPAFSMYSWLPGDGYIYSPFGYPFFGFGGRTHIGSRASGTFGRTDFGHSDGGGFRGGGGHGGR